MMYLFKLSRSSELEHVEFQHCLTQHLTGQLCQGMFFLLLLLILMCQPITMKESQQEMSIVEEKPAGTVVGQLDRTEFSPPFTLHFARDSDAKDIGISADGILSIKARIDRERQSEYHLIAESSEGMLRVVNVNVIDINDNAPIFQQSEVIITISETAPLELMLFIGTVHDLDIGDNGLQLCQIVDGNFNNTFELIVTRMANGSFALDLGLSKPLDYEECVSYNLIIRGQDGGFPPKYSDLHVNINVSDVNDNRPVFNQTTYFAEIPENSARGTKIIQVFGIDNDSGSNGKLKYFISPMSRTFEIDSESDIVVVKENIDYELQSLYELTVLVKDGGTPQLSGMATIVVRIQNANDNPPEISVSFLNKARRHKILRRLHVNDTVALVFIKDPDDDGTNVAVFNVFREGNSDKYFGLARQNESCYTIVVQKSLQAAKRIHKIRITAEDSGIPIFRTVQNVTLVIDDSLTLQESRLTRFSATSYEADIQATTSPGSVVIQFNVVKDDKIVTKHFLFNMTASESMSDRELFKINKTTGDITVRNRLNCETIGSYHFTVTAVDVRSKERLIENQEQLTTAVIINVRSVIDIPPRFKRQFYNVSMPEFTAAGECILQVSTLAIDCVGRPVEYSMIQIE